MKTAICTPARPQLDPDHVQAVVLTVAKLRELGEEATIYRTRGHSLLEQARSGIASKAYEWGADVLLWVDDDIVFEPEDAVRLIHTLSREQPEATPTISTDLSTSVSRVDVIGAVCSTKRPGAPINAGLDAKKATFYAGGGLARVKGHLGLGLTAHARHVYTAMMTKLPKVILNNEGLIGWPFYRSVLAPSKDPAEPLNWLGEDVTFHQRAVRMGMKLWADTRIRTIHRGEYDYRLEDCFFRVQDLETINVTLAEAQDPDWQRTPWGVDHNAAEERWELPQPGG